MNVLVVFFSVTFLLVGTSFSQSVSDTEEVRDIDSIVLVNYDDLAPRPMLDPDFESDLRDYCRCEDICLDKEEE